MNTYEEKRSLLLEMISFSTVDGHLHKSEYMFLSMVAFELDFDKADFDDLFHQELPPLVIKSEFERIQQFYRLALLMHCDKVLHEKELVSINEIGIKMGLNPSAMKRILKKMGESPNRLIEPEVILTTFQEQHN